MQGSGNNSPYGIQLLDDLHNYFPAILYNPDRFPSVRSVLEYIQTCTRERFDIFTNNSNNYTRNNPSRVDYNDNYRTWFNATTQNRRSSPARAQPANNRQPANVYQYTFPQETIYTYSGDQLSGSDRDAQLLSSLLGLFTPTNINLSSFMDPIPIYPTSAQINNASTIFTSNQDHTELNCSICREDISQNEELRRLNNCSHTFHKVCIDQWFRTNVHCPICRDDIRVLRSASQEDTTDN